MGTGVSVVGVVTATSFVGSGANLTGVLTPTGNGIGLSGIVTSIIAGTNVTISGATGAVTINASGGGGGGSIAGISTTGTSHFANLQLTGITTGLNVSGVSTFQSHVELGDSDELRLGAGNDLKIYHNGTNSHVENGTGQLLIRAKTSENSINCIPDGQVELYYDNSKKFETTNTGAVVTGILTATSFSGDGSALTGIAVTASSNVQVTWDVTANGSSAYRFAGPGNDASDDNPDLYLVRGQRYRFTNNSGGSHPFQIRSSAGGSAYSTGVTNNGASSGNIDFNVQHDAPARLYYQCTSHSGMVGNIYITGGANWQTTDVNTSTAEEIFTLNNVGIGTDNPQVPLHVFGNTRVRVGTDQVFSVTSGTAGVTQLQGINEAADTFQPLDIAGSIVTLSPNSSEALRITSGGDVGINTTSNNDGAHFQHYQSEARHQSFQSNNGDLAIVTDNNSNPAAYIKGTGTADLLRVVDGSTTVFTIKDGGNVEVNGNIVMGNGNGIDFSATGNSSGTTSSEVFDDYEEGTFTIGFTQSGATITANSSYNTMNYTKVGRICHIFGHIRVSTVSGSGSGNIKVTGLPFQVISGVNAGRGGLHVTFLDISESTYGESLKSAPFQFDNGTTRLELETARFTTISTYGNGDELMISGTYLVA